MLSLALIALRTVPLLPLALQPPPPLAVPGGLGGERDVLELLQPTSTRLFNCCHDDVTEHPAKRCAISRAQCVTNRSSKHVADSVTKRVKRM